MARSRRKFHPVVLRWSDLSGTSSGEGPFVYEDPVFKDYKILAEGDSWFSLNDLLPRGQFPTNILYNLRFRKSTLIVSCASPGDTTKNMAKISGNRDLREALSKDGEKWDVILLSGGGNDLLDKAQYILLDKSERKASSKKPEDFCSEEELVRLIDSVQQNYRRIAKRRDAENGSAVSQPMVTHTYDYVTPRNSPARFVNIPVSGPWVYKEFEAAKIPKKHWIELSGYLLERLAEGLLALEDPETGIQNFHVVNTLGTLVPADIDETGESNDWINEFHPSGDGYRKIVKKWYRVLDKLLD
jgi:lysophospholipase L1-like esterase